MVQGLVFLLDRMSSCAIVLAFQANLFREERYGLDTGGVDAWTLFHGHTIFCVYVPYNLFFRDGNWLVR